MPSFSPSGAVKTRKKWPPVGVIIVVVLGFIAAGGVFAGVWSEITIGAPFQTLVFLLFLLAVADTVAGYGLLKLKKWGRILKIIVSVATVCWLISVVPDAYKEGSASLALWAAVVAYVVAVVLYMFSTRVNQAFSKAS